MTEPFHASLQTSRATAQTLGAWRIGVFGLCLCYVLSVDLPTLASLPGEIYKPVGVLKLLPDFAHWLRGAAMHLAVIRWVTALVVVAAMLGLKPYRPLAILAMALMFLFDMIYKGHGSYINHAHFGMLYVGSLLAIFPSADAYAMQGPPKQDRPREHYVFAATLIGFIFVLPYVVIGVHRLAVGPHVFLQDHIIAWLVEQSVTQSYYGFDFSSWLLNYPLLGWLCKAGFIVVTAFEILSPFILINKWFRRVWIAVIVPFHLSTLFAMNIFFWQNVVLVLMLFPMWSYRLAMPATAQAPIVFYDGVCGLCNRFVQWVIGRDMQGRFQFSPLQGQTARDRGVAPESNPQAWSVVLVDEEGQHQRSAAVARIMITLGGGWSILGSAMLLIPRPLRDLGYRLVARYRYQWFGQAEACQLPTQSTVSRMLP